MTKKRLFLSIDKDIADMLDKLGRNRSKAVNIILRYALEKGILRKVMERLMVEESLLEELLKEKEQPKQYKTRKDDQRRTK
jgi:hypothetical protein